MPVIFPEYRDISEYIIQIEKKIGRKVVSCSRPLQKGPADDAGVKGFLIYIEAFKTITLFSAPKYPDDLIILDCISHAWSAGASESVLISADSGQPFFWKRSPDEPGWLEEICRSLCMEPCDISKIGQLQGTDPSEEIFQYLTGLRKELNSWIYRRDGETSDSIRELTIQILQNQILLKRMLLAHQEQDERGSQNIRLWDVLYSFASSAPVQDQYDIHVRRSDDETRQMVKALASTPVKSLKDIRLSWVEPLLWATIFTSHLAALPQKSSRKRNIIDPRETRERTGAWESGAGRLIAEALRTKQNPLLWGNILDPACGCGEQMTLVLRLIHMNMEREGRSTIISRLIHAGDSIYAIDASSISIAAIRFVITTWILDGRYRDPVLTSTPLWYPVFSLNQHIRAGSLLYDERIFEEFVSSQAGYQVLRHLHPLEISSLTPKIRPFSLILSYPDGRAPAGPPEVVSYLTRRFLSYQNGVSQAALMTELVHELLTPGGACITFLKNSWLSEISYEGFRRWLTQPVPITIVTAEEEAGRRDLNDLSAVIFHQNAESAHTVIAYSPGEGDRFRIRIFSINPGDYHADEGWGLHDPLESLLLVLLKQGTMPLVEYLFDEMYPGNHGKNMNQTYERWTSLRYQDAGLIISQGNNPDPDATIIIPGQDQYLIALFRSSLIRWYIRITARGEELTKSEQITLIRNLPIRAIDPYAGEEKETQEHIEKISDRMTMLLRKLEISHTWHDQTRVMRQMESLQKDLDHRVSKLYGFSDLECREIRKRLENFTHQLTQALVII